MLHYIKDSPRAKFEWMKQKYYNLNFQFFEVDIWFVHNLTKIDQHFFIYLTEFYVLLSNLIKSYLYMMPYIDCVKNMMKIKVVLKL